MAADAADPYCYPGTTVLRNKLDIRDPEFLQRAQDDLAAARYAGLTACLPKPPFTFDTLKSIHRELFQDVYDWADQPRITRIGKADFEGSRNITWFADPQQIESLARLTFRDIEDPRSLAGTSRQAFAPTAANLFPAVNEIHAFREGNGRAQRLLLTAIVQAAGHPVAFDVITRERMVATSVAAAAGDTSGFARMFEEITDPRRVEALRRGLHAMRRFGIAAWNDLYVATTQTGQAYDGILAGTAGHDFMMRVKGGTRDWIAIGDASDFPADAIDGRRVSLTAVHFSAATSTAS